MAIINNPLQSHCHCYALDNREMVVKQNGDALTFEDLMLISKVCGQTDLFEESANGICVLGFNGKNTLPIGYEKKMIRQHFFTNGEEEVLRISRAKALLSWRSNTRFCGRCGKPLVEHDMLSARICPECGNLIFPRIEPCIIVVVHKGNDILLARHVERNQDVYTCLAGFMEAGENAEQAVRREIFEETGIRVKNIRYYDSQSWPFPAQLMLAFTAEYESGEIRIQESELSDARWFDRDHCPNTPPPGSIAYRLIHQC